MAIKLKKSKKPLDILREKYFLKPNGNNVQFAAQLAESAITALVSSQGESPTYPVTIIPSIKQIIEEAQIPEKMNTNPQKYLQNLPKLIQGSVKAGHPYMVKNIIPTASLPALAAYFAVSPYMANGVTGEDAAQTLMAEIATASALSKLADIDHLKSAGIFTFGGTGTNLYAIKISLSKLLPEHNKKGVREDVVVIESAPSHYSHKTSVDWLGLGQNNLIKVSSNPDQTTNLKELEEKMINVIKLGKKIACIIAVGGTTSNMGVDDVKSIYQLRKKIVQKFNLPYAPHIHVDSVLGWAFLNFKNYDFINNPLFFRDQTLLRIKKLLKRVLTFKYADSLGVDFHKTGYVAYTSSMLIAKDKKDLMRLQRDGSIMTPLFHDDAAYNPGQFTLETSRSAANMLASWIALETFGQEGYQALLGHSIEMGITFREEVEKNINKGLYIANQEQYGADIFIRCYPLNVNPPNEYKKEMRSDSHLLRNNEYTSKFFKWLSENEQSFVSKTTAAIYTYTGKSMVALRIYPLSPYITNTTAKTLIKKLVKAKIQFDKNNEL